MPNGPEQGLNILVIGNAASVHIRSRARAMASLGHRVTILSDKNYPVPGLEVISLPVTRPWSGLFRSLETIRRLARLYALIRAQTADWYHVHFAYGDAPWLALAAGKRPLVVSTMGADILFEERNNAPWTARRLTTLLLRSAALVTAKTSHMMDKARALGVDSGRLMRVVWGVDGSVFHPRQDSGLRQRLGILPEALVVLSPRSITAAYNIDVVLDAFALLREKLPQAVLVLLDGNADPEYKQTMLVRARDLGILEAVCLVGSVAHEDMPDFYSMADVVLSMAWLTEGMPQSLLEAMACGAPCVATRLERYQEYVTEGRDILLTDLDADEAMHAMFRLLTDNNLAANLSKEGIKTIAQKADIDSEARRVSQALSAMDGPSRPPLLRLRAGALLLYHVLAGYAANLSHRILSMGSSRKTA